MKNIIAFDNDKYLSEQRAAILERVALFNNKLYLEFGGKLLFDYHAARVLPGFDPNVKMRLLQQFRDKSEIIVCIYAGDIERKKIRADFGITYDVDVLKLMDDLREWGLGTRAVVITRHEEQAAAKLFRNRLERRGIPVYVHRRVEGYPADLDLVVSDEDYGANPWVETTKPLVVVTAPGPGSGKLATCLNQIYHEHRRGQKAGYAKFETFPIWNLPLNHPVNVAYEAATADIEDYNEIDPYHLESYGKTAVNYNRDAAAFPIVRRILEKIMGSESPYRSPTDMGVNRAGFGIIDDDAVREAARQEIIRRYFRYACEYAMGLTHKGTLERIQTIMDRAGVSITERKVVTCAREAAEEAKKKGKGNEGIYCGAAIALSDGTIVTGKNSSLLHAASSLTLNALKHMAGIPDHLPLLPPSVIEAIGRMKEGVLKMKNISLDVEETLVALSISSTMNPAAQLAIQKLHEMSGCDMHLTHMPIPGDEAGLRRLGVNLTSDPNFSSKNLFAT